MSPAAVELIEAWIRGVVIGERFCPFAAQPFLDDDVLLEGMSPNPLAALGTVVRRAGQMCDQPLPVTTLLVAEEGFGDLAAFANLVHAAELALEELHAGAFAVAWFHPDFTFAELPEASSAHLIHRSPLPILQLLRREQLDLLVNEEQRSQLLARNAAHAAALGPAFFAGFRQNLSDTAS